MTLSTRCFTMTDIVEVTLYEILGQVKSKEDLQD